MIKFENYTNGRYYYLIQGTDLLNDYTLTIIHGGNLFGKRRAVRVYGYRCESDLQKEIHRLCKKRVQRGYTLVS